MTSSSASLWNSAPLILLTIGVCQQLEIGVRAEQIIGVKAEFPANPDVALASPELKPLGFKKKKDCGLLGLLRARASVQRASGYCGRSDVLTTQTSLYKFQRMEPPASRARVIRATLDLLNKSGLAGAGIKQVAAASAVPESSVSQLFPGGKLELATVALEEAERGIGQWFHKVFHQRRSIARKVELLFADAAKNVEAGEFMNGCPVAAVTLDLDRDSERLRAVCRTIFLNWQDIIAAGLDEVPKGKRREVAELILATLEGALILSRAEATKDPLLRGGRILGDTLARRFQAAPPRREVKSHRTRARNTRRP